ncbi:hypothetical protein ICN48_04655 [Polynucleobacter sp. JS-Safj-400b-B2]|uniref:hypothetical protein n=1 Tax=Polynucleobacter sp. JS-Safj-400b-B2 TaxID=2576921 RepID=UPI001C0BEF8A|nr:hypothetical protein [Polynucleobacter sp. JS-Safj-400b-B2]MBU3625525.1 hypothetical protein [Polynucleobacter sp. JS-Safj-400b-B2]
MIKLLKHDTVLKPFYIALSSDMRFHALYGDISIVDSNSISGAIEAIPNKHLYGVPNNAMDWDRLSPDTSMTNQYA